MQRLFTLALALVLAALSACERPRPFAGADLLSTSRQHVLVVVQGKNDSTGRLYRYEKDGGGFAPVGQPVEVSVGSGGVGKTREGDKRAPSGAYPLTAAFGYGATPPAGLRMPYVALGPETECVDDESSKYYNQVVTTSAISEGKTWKSSEMMRRDLYNKDDLYKLGLLVGYNPAGARDPDSGKGAGSCIFLHIWRGPGRPTVGCTSMSEENLATLLMWLDPEGRPLLVQGSREELELLVAEGRLPYALPPRQIVSAGGPGAP